MTTYTDYLLGLLRKKYVAVLCVIIATTLSYANVFSNTFVWDDKDTILRWEATRTWRSVPDMLAGATPPGHPGNYRPVRNILYIAAFKLWGVHPWGYHLQTVLLAVSIALLTYGITSIIRPNTLTPLLSALLFGTHPIHVEALTWMTSMMDMYGMVFGFGAIYLFLLWRTYPRRWFYGIGSWLATGLAIFSNEITLAVPLLMILIMYLFPRPKQRIFWSALPFVSIVFFNAYIRVSLLHIGARFTYIGDNITTTILVMLQAFLTYMRLLFFPMHLSINHDLGGGLSSWAIELIEPGSLGYKAVSALTPTTPTVLLSGVILLCLIVSAFIVRKKYPLYSFGIGWFFISMIPVSNLIPTEAVLTERFAFLASYGFCLLLAAGLCSISDYRSLSSHKSRVGAMIFVSILLFYMIATMQRNTEWRNEGIFWKTAATRNPNAFIPHLSYASYLVSLGDIQGALQEYITASSINPGAPDIDAYIAAMYHSLGQNKEAAVYLSRVLRKNPWHVEAYFRLGNIYKDQKLYTQAIETYTTALKIAPDHTLILNNLGVVYSITGQRDKAIESYQRALEFDPTYESARINLEKIQNDPTGVPIEATSPDHLYKY